MKRFLLLYLVVVSGCFSHDKSDSQPSGYFYSASENGYSHFDQLLIVRDSTLLIKDHSNGSPWVYVNYELSENKHQTTDGSFILNFVKDTMCVSNNDGSKECFYRIEDAQNLIADTTRVELLLIREYLERENGQLDSSAYKQITDWLFMTIFGKRVKINNEMQKNGPVNIDNCVGCD